MTTLASVVFAWETYHWFLVLGAPLIILELLGVWYFNRKGRDADTISQLWWDFRNSLPKPLGYVAVLAMLVFLGWLAYHFTVEGWRKVKARTSGDRTEPS